MDGDAPANECGDYDFSTVIGFRGFYGSPFRFSFLTALVPDAGLYRYSFLSYSVPRASGYADTDFTEVFAALHVPERFLRLLKGEDTIHHGMQAVQADCAVHRLEHLT